MSQTKSGWFDILNYVVLSIIVLACVYPFYYIFIYSISDSRLAQTGISLLPAGFTLDHYISIFKLNNIYQAFFVSLSRAVIGTLITLFCCSFFSYLLTKEAMYFRKLIYRFLVVTLYFNAGLIPWYLTMKYLGLKNNFLLYILPGAVVGFFVILMKTFIEQLPAALEESAMIDGAGYFTIFSRIIVPLSGPIIATIAVYCSVGQWNTWTDNFFLVSNPKLQTLQLILYNYLNSANNYANQTMQELNQGSAARAVTPESIKMTITMIVTIPIMLVYPFLQRYFVKGIMLGAIKG